MKPAVNIILAAVASLGFFSFLYVELASREYRSADGQLAAFRDALALDGCQSAKAVKIDFNPAFTDFTNRTTFRAGAGCVGEVFSVARKAGFEEMQPGLLHKDDGVGYTERLMLVKPHEIVWERRQT